MFSTACFASDTLIYIANKNKFENIEKMEKSNSEFCILGLDLNSKQEVIKKAKVVKVSNFCNILRIYITNGEYFFCTKNQRIFLQDGSIKTAQDLKEKDKLLHIDGIDIQVYDILNMNEYSAVYTLIIEDGYNFFINASSVFDTRILVSI